MLRALFLLVLAGSAAAQTAPPIEAYSPLAFDVPEAAADAAALVAERCAGFRGEATAYQQQAHTLRQRESMCGGRCSYDSAIRQALTNAQVAEQRYVGCLRDVERVVAEAMEEAREEALRLRGFAGALWGTAADSVRAQRWEEPAIQQDGVLCYGQTLFDLPSYACYYFAETGLAHGRYVFLARHRTPDGHIADFDAVADTLAASFGPPATDAEGWRSEPAAGETLADGLADGRAERTARWERPGGTMTMQLRRDDRGIAHVLEFVPLAE